MNPPNQQLIKQKRDVRDLINAESFKNEIAKVLPKHLTPERMTRVALTAFLKTPGLLSCTPESLTNALLICSQAGLEPDGRLAHLIPYGNACTVIFDYKGLVTLAIRNGMQAVYADKVCEDDVFDACVENGVKKITHRPDFRKSRGEAVCYYSVCQRDGVTDWEVMTKEEVDAIRARSKAGQNGPWKTDYDEMAKKTVLRRMSKRWDLLPEIADVINRDDDMPVEIRAPMAKPIFDVTPGAAPLEVLPDPPAADQASEAQAGLAPQPAAKIEPQSGPNYVKGVRDLCKMARVSEGALLDHLQAIGSTDGSCATLEELAMYEGGRVLKLTFDNWTAVLANIQGAEKGGGK